MASRAAETAPSPASAMFFQSEPPRRQAMLALFSPGPPAPAEPPDPATWWEDAHPRVPYEWNPPGDPEMLILIAYDITLPKRLVKVAKLLENWGERVQYSVFECRLEENSFEHLWAALLDIIDHEEDRLVAYRLDARAARRTLTAGTMACSEKVICYLV
jgi:CRISPR-associated protein Cas2